MVFSSIPPYVDLACWQLHQQQQQQQQQQQPLQQQLESSNNSTTPNHHHHLLPTSCPRPPSQPPTRPPSHVGGSSGGGSGQAAAGGSSMMMMMMRPGSMVEQARMVNIPGAALKCPRCESTNTKFCYFNNYSLSQPRHFCKSCRRYWTRGGALRNVPVGGGCRRNKRSKGGGGSSGSNKSTTSGGSENSATATVVSTTSSSANTGAPSMNINRASMMADILDLTSKASPLHLMSPLTSLSTHDYVGGSGDIDLGGAAATPVIDMSFPFPLAMRSIGGGYGGGSGSVTTNIGDGGGGNSLLSALPALQHFSSMSRAGMDPTTMLYPFHASFDHDRRSSFGDQVKMEENQEMSLSRRLMELDAAEINGQYHWGADIDGSRGGGDDGGAGGSVGSPWTSEMPAAANISCSSNTASHTL